MKLSMNRFVIQLNKSTTCQQHNIHRWQLMLAKSDGLSCDALEAIPVNGAANVLLAEDQAKTRVAKGAGCRQCHQSFAMYLAGCRIEDATIITGGQQSQPPGVALTGHA